MLLKIITPTNVYTYTISSVELDLLTGNIVIQEGHAPALMVLKPQGKISWLTSENTAGQLKFNKGIAEIRRHHIIIVLDQEINL